MPELLEESSGLESTNLGVFRTSTTVKGGRRFSFGALVVVGDRRGQVGFGYAKANEVPKAIEKAEKYAKRTVKTVTRVGTTINHEVEGRYGASKVRLIPASPGTGVVAGGIVRNVLEHAGISDCLTKCYGSTNSRNVIKAVFAALEQLRTPELVAELRGQTLEQTPIQQRIEKGKAYLPQSVGTREKAKGPVNTIGQDRKGGRGGRGGGGGRGGRGGGGRGPGGPGGPGGGDSGSSESSGGGGDASPSGGESAAS